MTEAKLPPTKRARPKITRKKAKPKSAEVGRGARTASEQAAPTRVLPAWERGARVGFKRSLYVAAPVLLWMLLSTLGVLSVSLSNSLLLCFSVLLYVLAIPLSIVFGLDRFALEWAPESSNYTIILIFLVVVALNFTTIGCFRGWLRGDAETG